MMFAFHTKVHNTAGRWSLWVISLAKPEIPVRQVCLALLESREEIAPFIEGDFEEYVTEMADVQTWGGEPELAIAAGVLQLPVTVYQQEQAGRPNPYFHVTLYYEFTRHSAFLSLAVQSRTWRARILPQLMQGLAAASSSSCCGTCGSYDLVFEALTFPQLFGHGARLCDLAAVPRSGAGTEHG